MADVWEKDLAQKTSLALTDYVRVIGTDNVSYKQRIASLASTLGVAVQAIINGSDLNDLTDIGMYYSSSTTVTASLTNKPSDLVSAFSMEVQRRGDYVNQIICDYAGAIYIRGQISSGWYGWQKLPTRAELNNLMGTATASFSGDANTLVDTGQYQIGNVGNVTNIPSGVSYGILSVVRARGYIKQIYSDISKRTEYVRTSTNTGANWTSWEHEPQDVPVRLQGSVATGGSFNVAIDSILSQNEGFALVGLNFSGNSNIGMALLYLGRGTSKIKDLLGTMPTSYYTASYADNVWTITNNLESSTMFYTIIKSR